MTGSKSFHTVAFDLDGTLTNPTRGLVSAIKYALKKMKLPYGSEEELKKYIGPPLRESWEREYGISGEQSERTLTLFREYFSVYGWWDNELYLGIPELLSSLKARGKRIILATSKPEVFAVKILKLFGIYGYFDFIGAATLDKSRETKEGVLNYALVGSGALADGREGIIMVGDRKYDIEGARLCGIGSLGVLWGFGDRAELAEAGADLIAESVADVNRLIL